MKKLSLLFLFVGLFLGCKPGQKMAKDGDGQIEVVFLQLNDVYEISPIGTESLGGLARVAQIRKDLLAKNPNTFTLLAGDFISPSVIGTLKHDGKRIRGKQMVEVFNALGLDATAFGNHEFDYDLADLQARLDESNFTWIGTNVRDMKTKQPFVQNRNGAAQACPDYIVLKAKDKDGTTLNIGVFGGTIASNPKPYVTYSDPVQSIQRSLDSLKSRSDVAIGLTHFEANFDKELLAKFPQVPLVMGGHEHDNQIHKVGRSTLAKADANAKTVYIHTLNFNKKTREWTLKSELRRVDKSISSEPTTAAVVAKWEKIKDESLRSSGFDPDKVVVNLKEPLDCRETTVRNAPCKAGEIITSAMMAAAKSKPDLALLNSGSIRVDDVLTGTLTEVDIVRMLPFGGAVVEAEMKGILLRKVLAVGPFNAGNGGFLQTQGAAQASENQWLIGGKAIENDKIYKVVLPEFLLTGNEANLGFLKAEPNPDGKGTTHKDVASISKPDGKDKADLRNDIRLALIQYWRKSN